MKNKFDIIHEDEDILVVNKPPFFLVIPDRYAPNKLNLHAALSARFGEVFVVHRLDKETSGAVCFARTREAHKALNEQFAGREVDKLYHALVEGRLHEEAGRIDKPIAASTVQQGRMVIAPRGKASVTLFRALEYFQNFTLVEANILTGRTHQVRVHFEAMGYPLAVDAVYGRREAFYLSAVKGRAYNGSRETERPLMRRTALHAYSLGFKHPRTGERLSFTAPLPKDFKAVLNQLRKWGR